MHGIRWYITKPPHTGNAPTSMQSPTSSYSASNLEKKFVLVFTKMQTTCMTVGHRAFRIILSMCSSIYLIKMPFHSKKKNTT